MDPQAPVTSEIAATRAVEEEVGAGKDMGARCGLDSDGDANKNTDSNN
jgi:hypothetical protein